MSNPANTFLKKLEEKLRFIYKENYSKDILTRLSDVVFSYNRINNSGKKWDENDAVLITYGDSIKKPDEKPLVTLKTFLDKNLNHLISTVHVLPFFPYSSDDGFSVIDFRQVNPELGTWKDIENLTENFGLITDLVINHASSQSQWFQNFLQQTGKGKDYFIQENPETNLSEVVRPRSSPLLTACKTSEGEKYVWTTFSADQVDLNFANPVVLTEMVDILLEYISKGARIIRLDAIAFLWKKPGSTCLHLPETHEVVKLLREIAEYINPSVIILTETNVPNKENLSYFGNGDEAHMVYQFSLPPLLLHALHTGNSFYLKKWAKNLPDLPVGCTFFSFTASHDGIGLRPLEGLIPEEDKNILAENMQEFGGRVNYKTNPDGSQSPYELNITYFDALKGTDEGIDEFQVERFLASQIIMMIFRGVPAFYIHSLTATPNYSKGVAQTGENRTINRRKWNLNELENLLEKNSPQHEVFTSLKKLISIRKKQKAFHPDAQQEILDLGEQLFGIIRTSTDKKETIICISNLTAKKQKASLPQYLSSFHFDIIQNKRLDSLHLAPYQSIWLR